MTYRKRLIFGLLLAMPIAAPSASLGADNFSSPSGASNWKKSGQPTAVDIRFKKPETASRPEPIIFTDQPSTAPAPIAAVPKPKPVIAAAKPAASPSLAPISAPAAVPNFAQNSSPIAARIIATPAPAIKPIPATSLPAAAISPPSDSIQPASQPQAFPLTTAPAAATNQTTASSTSAAPAAALPNSNQISDEQIQLVAQLLIDKGVIQAAEEEPLPTSPTAPIPSESKRDEAIDNGAASPYDGVCYDNCCPPPPRLFWVGGVEATFLWPDLNSEGVSFTAEEVAKERFDVSESQDSDVDSMYLSPRIWLGVQGCAWGANIRYWHLQASEGEYDPSIGGIGTWNDFDCGKPDLGFFTCNRLEAYTIDLEITRRFCVHDCWMQAAIGVRHAEIQNNESITGLALTDEGLLSGFARANRMSRGTGLLLGLYGRKPVYPCSCVHWFYNARISTLWGPTQTSAETFAAAQANDEDFVAGAASVNGAYTTVDDTLFIGEIQLGLEWDYALACLPANAFFRAAIEYQRWDGGRGFSAADSFAGIAIDDGFPSESIVSTSAGAPEPQMDLFGFTIGTGLTW